MSNEFQKYKRAFNEKVYNYLHPNRTNVIVYNLFGRLIDKLGKRLKWDSKSAGNLFNAAYSNNIPLQIYSDLKQAYDDDTKTPLANLVDMDSLRLRYITPLHEIIAALNDRNLQKELDAIILEVKALLKGASSKDTELGSYSEWVIARNCDEYMANANFVCLDCAYNCLFYYSQTCPFGELYPYRHSEDSPNAMRKVIDESIYVGCIILRMIHDALAESGMTRYSLMQAVISEFSKFLESEDNQGLFYIYKWAEGWYRDTENNHANEECLDLEWLIGHYIEQYQRYYNIHKYINKITVKDLFGYHSYTLDFDVDGKAKSDLSIIIGPNGLGKTTVLNILEAILKHPSVRDFQTRSDNEINKVEHEREMERIEYLCLLPFTKFTVDFSDNSSVDIRKTLDENGKTGKMEIELNPGGRAGFDPVRLPVEFEFLQKNGEFHIKNEQQTLLDFYQKVDMLFPYVNADDRFMFVHANRINDSEWRDAISYFYTNEALSDNANTVQAHIKNIEKWITPAFVTELNHKYAALKRDEAFMHNFKMFCDYFSNIYYDEDPSRKKIVIAKDGHIAIENSMGKALEFEDLSTGELNIATILYYTIFNTTKNAILFIDEPEISLHMAWQQQLADIIQEIIRDKDGMQVVITSHSPFIASGRKDLFVGAEING